MTSVLFSACQEGNASIVQEMINADIRAWDNMMESKSRDELLQNMKDNIQHVILEWIDAINTAYLAGHEDITIMLLQAIKVWEDGLPQSCYNGNVYMKHRIMRQSLNEDNATLAHLVMNVSNINWNNGHYGLCRGGKYLDAKSTYGFLGACAGGHVDLARAMFNGECVDLGLAEACREGYLDTVKCAIDLGASIHFKDAIENACSGGHLDIVKFLIEQGVNPSHGLAGAGSGGHIDILKELMKHGNYDLTECLEKACYGEHIDIVKYILQCGQEPSFNSAIYASGKGRADIVSLLRMPLELSDACYGGNMELINMVIANGDHDWDRGLRAAAGQKQLAVCELMLKNGADPTIIKPYDNMYLIYLRMLYDPTYVYSGENSRIKKLFMCCNKYIKHLT